jgi:Na+-translocating ferredoxin:NAD+ oxidoreductase RNF subunit RnfB
MAKILKVLLPEKCNGCELCLIETQKQLGKVGLDGSLIRILRSINSSTSAVEFQIELDPQVNSLDIKRLCKFAQGGFFP